MEAENVSGNHKNVNEAENGNGNNILGKNNQNNVSDVHKMTSLQQKNDKWDEDNDSIEEDELLRRELKSNENDEMEEDAEDLEKIDEDVKQYYVSENDDTMCIEEDYVDEQVGDTVLFGTEINKNALKRKSDELSGSRDNDFYGFDVEPYDLFEIKQINKRLKDECIRKKYELQYENQENKMNNNSNKYDSKKEITENQEKEVINSRGNISSVSSEKQQTNKENVDSVKTTQSVEQVATNKNDDKKSGAESTVISTTEQKVDKPTPSSRYAIYRKPLLAGWKRELVLRANPSSSKDKGEAYYITPAGKKLRTKSEIMQHLTPGLSIENFTFVREPLGFDPSEEIIRSAKLKSTSDQSILARKTSIDNNLGKRVPKPKAPKGASPPPQGWTPAKAVKSASIVMTSPRPNAQTKNPDDIENKANKSTSKSNKQTKKNVQSDLSTGGISLSSKKGINARHKISSLDSSSLSSPSIVNQQQTTLYRASFENFTANFFGNVSIGYDILLHTFQYLKVQELLRAACVCRMWNVVANHRSLWKTVRMKNSQINNWTGLTAVLKRNETKHLDLRKMLISNTNGDEMWKSFSENIQNVTSLEVIDLCRCSSNIVENLFKTNPNLKILNAITIKDEQLNLENLCNMENLQELRLKSVDGCTLESDLSTFKHLKNLKHLSLTSFRQLGTKNIGILGELICLETLELGDCTEFDQEFVTDVLPKLTKLERLRLEKGQEPCCTLNILEAISNLPNLTQLELVNFDVRTGFDEKLSQCKNLKKLLLIPTYVSQSATTNNIILKALLNLSNTLRTLTWVVTLELLRVTALYVVQCDDKKKDNKVFDESIPVLKPVPSSSSIEENHDKVQKTTSEVPQVEILPLAKVEKILSAGMPDTKFKILKVPYHATWRQNLVENQ